MKKLFTFLSICLLFTGLSTNAQIAYSPIIEDMITEITDEGLSQLVRELSGDLPTTLNGEAYTFQSRHAWQSGNEDAAYWIKEKFEEYGYEPHFMDYSSSGRNVIATIVGTSFPDKEYIICGHYDSMPPGSTAPGADDNASGTITVLEAARLLKDYESLYTIRFIAFDEEEIGLVGSYAYADSAVANDQDILGVLNMDMLAWDSNDDNVYSISTNDQSAQLTADYEASTAIYVPELTSNHITTTSSDHSPFWNAGYPALLAIEDWNDFHLYYHTVDDTYENMNIPYFTKMAKAAVASLASLAWGYNVDIMHEEVISSDIIEDREVVFTVNNPSELAVGTNEPRVYFRVNQGDYDYVNAVLVDNNIYTFMIPGQPIGSEVDYYFALQTADGGLTATFPSGGAGINPPGTEAPNQTFSYFVDFYELNDFGSSTLPKPINDLAYTDDTIHIAHNGTLLDANVNISLQHTQDSELMIMLMNPAGDLTLLSNQNGGDGDNYMNTIFDDEGSINITSGNAPFTGTYIPQTALSQFDGCEVHGDWIIRIYDNSSGDTGQLQEWGLTLFYTMDVTPVSDVFATNVKLYQNMPNPFNNSTTISFDLPKPMNITLNIHDITGKIVKQIADKMYNQGNNEVVINASDLKPGQYIYRLQSNDVVLTRKMIITK